MFLDLQSSDDSSTLLSVTSFPGEESRMITVEFITALFYEVDALLPTSPRESRFSMAYSPPYEGNLMTWRAT